MAKVEPRIPSGFQEYMPNEQMEFNRLVGIVQTTFERYGFTPLTTPVLELAPVILAKEDGETAKQVYRFDHGKNDFILPFDLTVPFARYVAQHANDLDFPFARYQIDRVHRAERAQRGRFREFYQCDIDVIGSTSPIVDAQFPAIINDIFSQFNFGEFTIRVNDRRILNGFFESLGLESQAVQILQIVDKIQKIGPDEFVDQLRLIQLNNSQIKRILDFITITGSNDQILKRLTQLEISSELYRDGVTKLATLVTALRAMGVPERRFQVDLKITRGLNYYTGAVYETFLNDHPEIGSVCSGGRYDDLASHYTNTKLPGVGISIGMTRLFDQLLRAGIIKPKAKSPAKIMVMPLKEEQFGAGIQVAARLRSAGIPTQLYTELNDLNKKFRFAERMGFAWVVIIGARDVTNGTVEVKNMTTRESINVPIADLTRYFDKI